MRTEGMGYSAISRFLGVKPDTIYFWVKSHPSYGCAGSGGVKLEFKVISLDEMWTYAGTRVGEKRNDLWVWTVVTEGGWTLKWVAGMSPHSYACWSGCRTRRVTVSTHTGHMLLASELGKGGAVNWNDGLHSALRALRGRLNRLVLRTKGYSKTDRMLTLSLALAWLTLGWI